MGLGLTSWCCPCIGKAGTQALISVCASCVLRGLRVLWDHDLVVRSNFCLCQLLIMNASDGIKMRSQDTSPQAAEPLKAAAVSEWGGCGGAAAPAAPVEARADGGASDSGAGLGCTQHSAARERGGRAAGAGRAAAVKSPETLNHSRGSAHECPAAGTVTGSADGQAVSAQDKAAAVKSGGSAEEPLAPAAAGAAQPRRNRPRKGRPTEA